MINRHPRFILFSSFTSYKIGGRPGK